MVPLLQVLAFSCTYCFGIVALYSSCPRGRPKPFTPLIQLANAGSSKRPCRGALLILVASFFQHIEKGCTRWRYSDVSRIGRCFSPDVAD